MKQKIKSLISLKTTSAFFGLLFFVALAGGMAINAPSALAVAPTIDAAEGEVGSDQVVLTFSGGVYNATGSPGTPGGDLAVADFAIVDTDNSRTISAVAHTAGASTATLTLSAVLDDTTDIGVDTIAFVVTSAYNATDEAGGTGTTTINDTTAPTVVDDWTLNMNAGTMTVNFSEPMDDSANVVETKITIQQSNNTDVAGEIYTLTDSASVWADVDTLTVTLSTTDLNAIKTDTGLGISTATSFLEIVAGSLITDKASVALSLTNVTDGARIYMATVRFKFVDDFHGSDLGTARDRPAWESSLEKIHRVMVTWQFSLDN